MLGSKGIVVKCVAAIFSVRRIQSKKEGDNGLWTSYAAPFVCLFQNKVTFLLKIML